MKLSSHTRVLLVFILLSSLLRIALIAQDIETILSKFMTDDSFYAYDVAYNVANGKGITFNENVPTNGFHPLYNLLVLPPLMKIFLPFGINAPIYASLVTLSAFTIITGVLIYLTVTKMLNKNAGLFASFIWLFSPYVIFVSLMGLETPVQVFILSLLTWFLITRNICRLSVKEALIVGVLVGLIFLARMDSVFVGVGVVLSIMIRKFANKIGVLDMFKQKDLYVIILTASLVVSPWLIWSYLNVGRITPHSGDAGEVIDYIRYIKSGDNTYADLRLNVVHSFGGFVTKFFYYPIDSRLLGVGTVLLLFVIPLTFLALKKDRLYKMMLKLDYLLISAALYYLYYFVRAVGVRDWYSLFTSFFISITFTLILFRTVRRLPRSNLIVFLISAILIIGFVYGGTLHYQRGNCPLCLGTYNMAKYVTQNIPPTETIAAFGAGVLQYYTPNHDVIDLDGVVNPVALEALKEDNLDKFALENNVSYVIETRIPWFYEVLFNKSSIKYEESKEDFITEYWSYKKEDRSIFTYKVFRIEPA